MGKPGGKIPKDFHPSVIAIDGPLLPEGAPHDIRRHVESVFIRAPFHNRCRSDLSHHGVGLELRQASGDAGTQFGSLLANSVLMKGGTVRQGGPYRGSFSKCFSGRADARSRTGAGTKVQARTAI
jgi:hypothetical protein